jgi:hypothetical protein
LTAKKNALTIYTIYNELLELNPEKPKEVKEEVTLMHLSKSLLELNPEKI